MKKIFLILSALCVFLLLIFSNANLCNAQQATGPQNLLNKSSSENKIEVWIQVGIYDIDVSNLSAEVDIVLTVTLPYERESENLQVWIWGGPTVSCNLLGRWDNRTSYMGTHVRTHWLIDGSPELYPFESYSIYFPIIPSISKWEWENFGFIFDERSGASFQGDKTRALINKFKTKENDATNDLQVYFENYALTSFGPEGQYKENYPMLVVHTERREHYGYLVLSPVFLAYALLVFSFMLKVPEAPKKEKRDLGGNLRNRLTIYLALFAFSVGFFFSLGPISPIELSLAELLVINLSICVSLSGIFSIVSSSFFKNLDFFALVSCMVSTYIVLWSQFLGNLAIPTMAVSIAFLVPWFIFLISSFVFVLWWLHRTGFSIWKLFVRITYLLLLAFFFITAMRTYASYPLRPIFITSLTALAFLIIFSFPKPCIFLVLGRKLKPAPVKFSQRIRERLIETKGVENKSPERILVLDTPRIQAYGIGTIFWKAIIFTKGLLAAKLKEREFLAISLHEVYHCENLHVAFLLEIVAISFVAVGGLLTWSPFWIIVLLLLWTLPLLESYFSWQYSADELAARGLGKKPIISALEKLQSLKKKEKTSRLSHWLGRITHPTVEKRIKRIRELKLHTR